MGYTEKSQVKEIKWPSMVGDGHDLGRGRNIRSLRSSSTGELQASLSYTETLSQKFNKIKQKPTNRKQNQTTREPITDHTQSGCPVSLGPGIQRVSSPDGVKYGDQTGDNSKYLVEKCLFLATVKCAPWEPLTVTLAGAIPQVC